MAEKVTLVEKWHNTKKGKTVIIAGTILAIAAVGAYFYFKSKKADPILKDDAPATPEATTYEQKSSEPSQIPESIPNVYDETNLPNNGKGCGEVIKSFGSMVDYVKCDGVWYSTGKKNVKWTSLAGNKTAIELLDNKYS